MRIIKLIGVLDTRRFEETTDSRGEDTMKPVPGTGEPHDCDRCGRGHEIHAIVELEDGSRSVVGTACMRAGDDVSSKALRSGAALATRISRLRHEVAALDRAMAGWRAASATVDAMPVPEIVSRIDGKVTVLTCGDGGRVLCRHGVTDERRQCAVRSWREKRLAEAGYNRPVLDDGSLRRRLSRAEEKMMGLGGS